MNRYTFVIPSLSVAIVVLAGCNPAPVPRYTLNAEQLPNGTVTRVIDEKLRTELLYITELSLKPPSITVLPMSRLDVSSVSVGPNGQEAVLVGYNEKDGGFDHNVLVSGPGRPSEAVLGNTDTNKDGKTDKRVLRFQTETGFIQYFDFDANGILDAQYSMALEGESNREARILVGQCWVLVEGDSTAFYESVPKVTSKEEPPANYQYHDGTWRKTEIPATPQQD